MQQNNQSKKVLLKITDLKQWFPIKKTKLFQKEQLYVRANDGITLDIYEGETVGLDAENRHLEEHCFSFIHRRKEKRCIMAGLFGRWPRTMWNTR